jgi:glycosyltransferase involved in cell wall biosynthesis
VRWIRNNSDLEIEVLLLEGGPLGAEFAAICPTTIMGFGEMQEFTRPEEMARALAGEKAGSAMRRLRLLARFRTLPQFSILYLNSVGTITAARYIRTKRRRLVLHVHEMEYAIRRLAGDAVEGVLRNADLIIGASGAVAADLRHYHSVNNKIAVIYEPIDFGRRLPAMRIDPRIFGELGIERSAHVVMSAGTLQWNKGPDLFLQLARCVSRRTSMPIHFVWVGDAEGEPGVRSQLELDATRAGLDSYFHILPTVDDLQPFLAAADVFVSTSHEDSFPLVCLEAAALEKPVLCFDSSGISELFDQGAMEVAPHLDVDFLADRLVELFEDADHRRLVGTRARIRAIERASIDKIGAQLWTELEPLCAVGSRSGARRTSRMSGQARPPKDGRGS